MAREVYGFYDQQVAENARDGALQQPPRSTSQKAVDPKALTLLCRAPSGGIPKAADENTPGKATCDIVYIDDAGTYQTMPDLVSWDGADPGNIPVLKSEVYNATSEDIEEGTVVLANCAQGSKPVVAQLLGGVPPDVLCDFICEECEVFATRTGVCDQLIFDWKITLSGMEEFNANKPPGWEDYDWSYANGTYTYTAFKTKESDPNVSSKIWTGPGQYVEWKQGEGAEPTDPVIFIPGGPPAGSNTLNLGEINPWTAASCPIFGYQALLFEYTFSTTLINITVGIQEPSGSQLIGATTATVEWEVCIEDNSCTSGPYQPEECPLSGGSTPSAAAIGRNIGRAFPELLLLNTCCTLQELVTLSQGRRIPAPPRLSAMVNLIDSHVAGLTQDEIRTKLLESIW